MGNFNNNTGLNIQREEKEFFSILEALPYGIILVKTNKEIYFANKVAKQMAGDNNLKGQLCHDSFCFPAECNCPVEKNGELDVSKKNLRRKDGATLPILKTAQPLILNKQHYYLEVITDISKQDKTEKALKQKARELKQMLHDKQKAENKAQQEAEKFETLFNQVPDAVFVHDVEGNFLKVNPKACVRLGYSKDELLKMNISDIDSSESSKNAKNLVNNLEEEGSVMFEAIHVSKEGKKIPVEIFSKIIDFEGQKAVLSSARNITQRK